MGDDVQAIKAGILECADVFAVNKADRDGADATVRDLQLMIALGGETVFGGSHSAGHARGQLDVAKAVVEQNAARWIPPIQKCVASKRQGVEELVAEARRAPHVARDDRARYTRAATSGSSWNSRARCAMRWRTRSKARSAAKSPRSRRACRVARSIPYTACELIIERFRTR